MNKKILSLSISLMAAILFIFSASIQAVQFRGNGFFGDNGEGNSDCFVPASFGERGGFQQLGRYLDLSNEQRQQLHKIRFEFMKKSIDLKGELGQKRLERRILTEKDAVDWKEADQLTDKIGDIRAEMEKLRMRQRHEIRKILTPAQLEEFEEMRGWKRPTNDRSPQRVSGRGPGAGRGRGRGW